MFRPTQSVVEGHIWVFHKKNKKQDKFKKKEKKKKDTKYVDNAMFGLDNCSEDNIDVFPHKICCRARVRFNST